jgi:hypothetical protein
MYGYLMLNRRKAWLSTVPSLPSIIVNDLGSFAGTNNATSYATSASYQPTANALILAFVIITDTASIGNPSLDGTTNGFVGNDKTNWASIANVTYNSLAAPLARLYVFRYMSASPTSTTGTFNWSAGGTGCIIRVVEFVNVDTSGSEGSGAVVQVVTDRQDATANPSVNLAALNSSGNNAVIACIADDVNSAVDNAPDDTWLEFSSNPELNFNTPAIGGQWVYKIGTTDNSVTTTATSRDWAIAAIEIEAGF